MSAPSVPAQSLTGVPQLDQYIAGQPDWTRVVHPRDWVRIVESSPYLVRRENSSLWLELESTAQERDRMYT